MNTSFITEMYESTGFIFWFLCVVMLFNLFAGDVLTTSFLLLVLVSMIFSNIDKVSKLLGEGVKQ